MITSNLVNTGLPHQIVSHTFFGKVKKFGDVCSNIKKRCKLSKSAQAESPPPCLDRVNGIYRMRLRSMVCMKTLSARQDSNGKLNICISEKTEMQLRCIVVWHHLLKMNCYYESHHLIASWHTVLYLIV